MSAILKAIVRETALELGVEPRLVTSNWRRTDLTRVRQIGVYIARHYTRHSTTQIGDVFGRDHSTLSHAFAKIEREICIDAELAEQVRRIVDRIRPLLTLPVEPEAGQPNELEQLADLLAPRLAPALLAALIPLLTAEKDKLNDR